MQVCSDSGAQTVVLSCLCIGLQVALKAVQKRLNSSNISIEEAAKMSEISKLQGALQQASTEYQQLLVQYKSQQESDARSRGAAVRLTKLQTTNKALSKDLADSRQQAQQSQQQLQQSQEQLRQYMQETDKLQHQIAKLSKAVMEMHTMVERAEASGHEHENTVFSARHNLQAVHNAVQNKLTRYDSNSSEFSASDILLPALWKPQRERYIAPTGFR